MEPKAIVHQCAPPLLIERKLRQIQQVGKGAVECERREIPARRTDHQIVRMISGKHTGTQNIRAALRLLYIIDRKLIAILQRNIPRPQRIVDHLAGLFLLRDIDVHGGVRIRVQNGIHASGIIVRTQRVQAIRLCCFLRVRIRRFRRLCLCRIPVAFGISGGAAARDGRGKEHGAKKYRQRMFHGSVHNDHPIFQNRERAWIFLKKHTTTVTAKYIPAQLFLYQIITL